MGNKAHIERMLDITPERLVECGFEHLEQIDYFIKFYNNGEHKLILDLTHGNYFADIEQAPKNLGEEYQLVNLRPITKMHELQALWKVLTGEKLKENAT